MTRESHSGGESRTFQHQEFVQFPDGELSLRFREPGDKLVLGMGSTHKYARDFYGSGMALIRTKSGNTYGLAGGYVFNAREGGAWHLPDDDIEVTIGEPCTIPGVGSTSDVEGVLLRYKVGMDNTGAAQLEQNPWPGLEAMVNHAIAADPQQ